MSLKADMNADISEVFLNLEDFGERHVVDGKEIIAVFYDEELIPGNQDYGLTVKSGHCRRPRQTCHSRRKQDQRLKLTTGCTWSRHGVKNLGCPWFHSRKISDDYDNTKSSR